MNQAKDWKKNVSLPLERQGNIKRLDRKMIGEPMNFVHITHFGTKEMTNNPPSVGHIQERMNSKGGYSNNSMNIRDPRTG
ncbi:hypothetical protein E2320_013429 [Naja naja]|nr:hypothetical protein E2320_013429 [Naja naja]